MHLLILPIKSRIDTLVTQLNGHAKGLKTMELMEHGNYRCPLSAFLVGVRYPEYPQVVFDIVP